MTTETKPATDGEVEAMRSSHGIDLADFQQRIGPLIARIDAERERADKAETAAAAFYQEAEAHLRQDHARALTERDALATQLTAAQQQIAALREALTDATAHLVGAASAYRKHATRHRSQGRAVADPFFSTRAADFEKAADRARAALAQTEEPSSCQWMAIDTAPKDGTRILAWCVHDNAKWASEQDRADWEGPVIARWIEHNGGGWMWHGLAGRFTHWMPLPEPPKEPRP